MEGGTEFNLFSPTVMVELSTCFADVSNAEVATATGAKTDDISGISMKEEVTGAVKLPGGTEAFSAVTSERDPGELVDFAGIFTTEFSAVNLIPVTISLPSVIVVSEFSSAVSHETETVSSGVGVRSEAVSHESEASADSDSGPPAEDVASVRTG